MDTNDFNGSFAQENVTFQTQIVKTARVGDNFMKTCIFVTELGLTADGVASLVAIPGSTYKALAVNSANFAAMTTGLLQSWLVDLYANGNTYDTILVSLGDGAAVPTEDELSAAYNAIKAYAYHKTICVGKNAGEAPATSADLDTALISKLIDLCTVDKSILSSAVLLPYSVFAAPTGTDDDPIYTAAKDKFSFLSCHTDATRNPALYSLGLALAAINGSGTPIGNPMCRPASSNITQSDALGDNDKIVRTALNALHIQTFKPVGDNTGNVCAEGEACMNGDLYSAQWILAYVSYMTKVGVAQLVTGNRDFYKMDDSYQKILGVLQSYLKKFGQAGSRRLKGLSITAPAFIALPESAAEEIVIPNAWVATYVGIVNKVAIVGTLYIEV